MARPHVNLAVLCVRASLAGETLVIDRLATAFVRPGPAPLDVEGGSVDLQAFVLLAPGSVLGRRRLAIGFSAPSGRAAVLVRGAVDFSGPDELVAWMPRVRVTLREAGLWWFDLFLDDGGGAPLTRMPLRVEAGP